MTDSSPLDGFLSATIDAPEAPETATPPEQPTTPTAATAAPEAKKDYLSGFLDATKAEPGEGEEEPAPSEPAEPAGKKAQAFLENVVREKQRLLAEKRALSEDRRVHADKLAAAQKYQDILELAKTDPLAAQELLAIDPESLIKAMVQSVEKNKPLTPEERLDQLENRLRAEREAIEKAEEEKAESMHIAEFEQLRHQFVVDVQKHAETNLERYELIKAKDAAPRVWNATVAFHKQTGRFPDLDLIMNAVETDLREDVRKVISTNYFKTSMMQEYQALGKPAETVLSKNNPPASLTNRMSRSSAPIKDSSKPKPQEETKERRKRSMDYYVDMLSKEAGLDNDD